jgi:PiT family inorganic phosphate transporter
MAAGSVSTQASSRLRTVPKPAFATADVAVLKNYKGHIDKATRFIPLWVKVAVG